MTERSLQNMYSPVILPGRNGWRTVIGKSLFVAAFALLAVAVPAVAAAWTEKATFETLAAGSNGADGNAGNGDGLYRGNDRTLVVNTVSHSGSNSLRIFLPGGTENTYQTPIRFPTAVREGEQLWGRFYMYVPTGFDWTSNPITKLFRYAVVNASNGSQGYISILATRPGNYSCPGTPNDHGYIVGGSEALSSYQFICQNVDSKMHFLAAGQWHALELYVRVSSTGGGIYRIWHNGALIWEKTGINSVPAGYFIPSGSEGYSYDNHLLGWWNGGVPKDQYLYFDDLVYTNQTPSQRDAKGNPMIGLTDSKPVLAAPTILSVQ